MDSKERNPFALSGLARAYSSLGAEDEGEEESTISEGSLSEDFG